MTELPTIPVTLRVHLAHATLQAIAEECGADVLHIKGPAVDPSLRPEGRASVDADVLVRPAHLKRLLRGLKQSGWKQVTTLRSGGVVEHSTNWYHGALGQVDVHVRFPGIQIEPERAFDRLWEGRGSRDIGSRRCPVPGLVAQRLFLLLHAARDIPRCTDDIHIGWDDATEPQRAAMESLARELRAEVALAAATGRLEEYRHRPEYSLWRHYSYRDSDGVEFRKLAAQSAPDGTTFAHWRAHLHVLSSAIFLPRHLRGQLGRRPNGREIAHGYWRVVRAASKDLGRLLHFSGVSGRCPVEHRF